MSFSENIKNEILEAKNKKCCMVSMRFGELITEEKGIKVSELKKIVTKPCCKKAFLKGIFLGSGCIVNPNTDYHFEISVKSKVYADFVIRLISEFNLTPKLIKRGASYIIYLKEAEQISTFIAILEANKAFMEYENIRIDKSIKNTINRVVNCETANMTKVAKAAVSQIEAINKLKKTEQYDKLNTKLKEIADLRIQNPEASLDELKDKCSYKISKSGIYHRLNKIINLTKGE